ncbi:MAG: ATP-dependent Clp protease ATP-binding subunit [Clostridia bacterium]|nr:ATP-dependent Clp protease ATP-binding subunit [Clostridia bacterium]
MQVIIMVICSRCKKRIAVVFVAHLENGQQKQEGLCIQCAKDLGIAPVNDIIKKMGISDEDLERMNAEMETLMDASSDGAEDMDDNDTDTSAGGENSSDAEQSLAGESRAPTVDLGKLFGPLQMMQFGSMKNERKSPKKKENAEKKKEYKYLNTYCQNLTERAKNGLLDAVIGRARELDRVIQILCRRQKNNPCLIGEPGVGKTAIAEALAQKIATGDVPYRLRDAQICLVDLTALVAGTQFRGQFESRMLGLLGDVKAAGNVILVIDEVHSIVGAGDAEGSMNAANILKPALSRGEIQIIGATTLTEYRKHIEKDTALERRFQPVMVNEPNMADTEEILAGIKHYYEEYHGIHIPDTVLHAAVSLSERYITDRYLPDKAIDLIDEAASHISLSSNVLNEKRSLADRCESLRKELETLEAKASSEEADEETYKKLADIKAELLRIEERNAFLAVECDKIEMHVSDIADVIEIWTGIPASTITENEYDRLSKLEERLSARIIGQAEAVSAVSRAIRRNRAGVSFKRKPVSFIFAGPTGVGKTELVKVLSEDLFSSPETLIRLDMSEFMDKFSVSRIIGAPPGYVGYDDAGQLTEKIRRRPYSVVLFDEIEKAHPDVMNILLQILDDGRITDAHGKTVSFENTVIIMTTNAGSSAQAAPAGFSDLPDTQVKERTARALAEFLRPEFLNRVDEVITFRSLSKDDFVSIAVLMLGDTAKALREKNIRLTWTDNAVRCVAEKSFSAKYGARNMRRFIQTEVEDRIATEIIESGGKISAVDVDAKDGQIAVRAI